MQKQRGIILKKNQGQSTSILLDQEKGKINILSKYAQICTGALLVYTISPLRRLYVIEHVELLHVPFVLAREDILFLHHVLELCTSVVQEGQEAGSIIQHISLLYRHNDTHDAVFKKLFISKLCMLLSLYPEQEQFRTSFFEELSVESLDTVLRKNIHLEFEKELDAWLFYCMAAYPHARYLKTLHFLTRNRVV